MSLEIDASKVTAVLLKDSGWHECRKGTFYLDAFEVHDGEASPKERQKHNWWLLGGDAEGVSARGFEFKDRTMTTETITGPITSILALKTTP